MAKFVNSKKKKFDKTTTRRGKTSSNGSKFDKRVTEDRSESYDAYSKENDAAWYAQNSQLMSDVASFSYNYPLGAKLGLGSDSSRYQRNSSVPGIFTIHTTARFGNLRDANDPINVAMRNIYSFVRHANSGSTNYEAPDLMLYLMAMDSCYSFIETLKRAYGVMLTYSATNRYFPLAAIHAMGFNFNDLQQNLADFRAYINTLAVKVGSMCVPASMSYMARHLWMYSGLYYDTPSDIKAQVYMYVPETFYRFNYDADGAGALTLVDFDRNKYSSDFVYPRNNAADGTHGWKFADLVEFGDALITPILEDEEFNIMSGDILKAFGSNNIYMVNTISETYTVLPIYSQEVLNQIHNTTMLGRAIQPNYAWNSLPVASYNNSIVQSEDKTYLINHPHAAFIPPMAEFRANREFNWEDSSYGEATLLYDMYNQVATTRKLLDFESGPVRPEDAMVASRLTTSVDGNTWSTTSLTEDTTGVKNHGCDADTTFNWMFGDITTCGSETAGYAKIWYWANVGYNSSNDWCLIHTEDIYSVMWNIYNIPGMTYTVEGIDSGNAQVIEHQIFAAQRKGLISTFNMHPSVADVVFSGVIKNSAPGLHSKGVCWPQFDVNYYTVLDEADLQQMHEVALISEFNITQYGRKA